MSKNAVKIAEGLKNITHSKHELMSGTVVPGTVDMNGYTCSVLLTDMDEPIQGVMLNATVSNTNGIVLFPADGSDVVIGSIDGSGQYFLLRAGTLTQAIVQIGQSTFTIDAGGYGIAHNGESLTHILNDLLNAITLLTVPTNSGPSGVPVNTNSFKAIQQRLNNLLL